MLRKLMLALGTMAVVGCGGISKEQYGAKEAEAAKYKGQATTLESEVNELQRQNATLQSQLAETNAAKYELEVTMAKMTKQSGELQSKQTLKLNDELLFKEGSSKLTPESQRALDAIADAVSQVKDKHFIVAGYTDNTEAGGKEAKIKRWQLSTARAMTVAKYLAGRGIDPTMIGVAGFGEARPVAPNDTIANRVLNRRVEIALMAATLDLGTVDVKPAQLKTK